MISAVFNQPGVPFVLMRDGIKYPPIEKEWQHKGHTFQEAAQHIGNVGIIAGNGYIGLDQDDPEAFEGIELPQTTMWETRPGRLGMWFTCNDRTSDLLARYGKKADLAQFKLFKDGQPVGEVKLERTYQVIPPSWKTLEDGQRAEYKMLCEVPPAEISLATLLEDLQSLGITFEKSNGAKEVSHETPPQAHTVELSGDREKRYAWSGFLREMAILSNAPVGNRNHQLNKSAYKLAGFVASGLLDEQTTKDSLYIAAELIGLPHWETVNTLERAWDAGKRRPREVPNKKSAWDTVVTMGGI